VPLSLFDFNLHRGLLFCTPLKLLQRKLTKISYAFKKGEQKLATTVGNFSIPCSIQLTPQKAAI